MPADALSMFKRTKKSKTPAFKPYLTVQERHDAYVAVYGRIATDELIDWEFLRRQERNLGLGQ